MRKIIHHLRRQPEHVKRHILHFMTAVFGIILAILWVYSLGRSVTNPDSQAKVRNDLKPFTSLKNNIIDGYNSISQPNLGVTDNTAQ